MLDLRAQYDTIRSEANEAIQRVVESQHFILGPEVEALEQEIAGFCGSEYAIGVSSGTDALLAALMSIQVSPGDEVITTAYSFFATAGVIARVGARPVFVDIDSRSFNIDAAAASEKVNVRTKAIMPVHLFGRPAEMDPILEVAKKKNICVIEDAAQAIGARDKRGRRAGTIGNIGCFSFFPSKNLGAFGDGGMVVTSHTNLAQKLKVLRVHGGEPKYYHHIVGGNFRLDALQAAVLRVKLKYLEKWTEARRINAGRYRAMFQDAGLSAWASVPEDTEGHIYNQFVVRFPDRNGLKDFLRQEGVETEIYYPVPLHLQTCFRHLGYQEGSFPNAEAAARDSLALPIYPEITEDQQQFIVEKIRDFYQ